MADASRVWQVAQADEEILLPASPPPAAISPAPGAPRCSEDGCSAQATHQCIDGCDFLCAEHDRISHALFPSHARSSLVDQHKKKQLLAEAKAAKRASMQAKQTSAVEAFETRLAEITALHYQDVEAFAEKRKAEESAIAAIYAAGAAREVALQKTITLMNASAETFAMLQSEYSDKLRNYAPLDVEAVVEDRLEFESRWIASGWFSFLTPQQTHSLKGFLGPTKSLAGAKLLYQASRDGWLPKDFFLCCTEKGPTLMLVKAAGTDYILGAYTAVAWPKSSSLSTPDPSGTSFMFSLANKYKRPFRLSLKDKSHAITTGTEVGLCFGGIERDAEGELVKCPNLILMYGGKAANEANGNASNSPIDHGCAYQLDPSVGEPPAGFELNTTTLAGSHYFTAAEIEVPLVGRFKADGLNCLAWRRQRAASERGWAALVEAAVLLACVASVGFASRLLLLLGTLLLGRLCLDRGKESVDAESGRRANRQRE